MIYIHFPFCKSFCTYCDFYSVREKDRIAQYTQSLLREISLRKAFLCQCTSPATLYVGGGTPSLWPVEQLGEAVAAISAALREGAADYGRPCGALRRGRDTLALAGGTAGGGGRGGLCGAPGGGGRAVPGTWDGRGNVGIFAEFTVEVNPDDVMEAYARALRRLGVNRVSMGVQSFSDRSLRWMARRHSSDGAVEAFRVLRSAGFDNISLDLIFGYDPVAWGSGSSSDEELMQLWSDDLDAVLRLRPEHISAYQMGIEEGSVLGEMAAAGRYREPSDELCAAQYALLQQRLTAAGYLQYEVSNFSLPGRRALHNSGYWDRSPYIGLGPGAHSFDGDRRRCWNVPDLDRYIAAFGVGSASGGFSASGGVSASGDALASDVAPASTPAFGEDLPASSCGSASSAVPITGDFSTSAYRDCAVSSVVSEEILTDEDVLTETIMLGLRTVDGLPLDVLVAMCRPSSSSVPDSRSGFAQPSSSTVPDSRSGAAENSCQSLLSQLPHPLRTSVDRLLATGSLILRDDRLSIPPSRLFISDSIIRELL
ncbi:MAG TPA: coproporphyrinogen III oxidase family protein [Candidatus Coprenecus merdigallinarum]|nr:coproporphyrinogen III oxidase family protein [Candidatus Coprenecus merdigallinarum]